MDILRMIGWDKENHKPIWRQVYYVFSLIILIFLAISAIPTLEQDDWGYDSFYMHKTILVGLTLGGIYYAWGYIQLYERVHKLEKLQEDSHTKSKANRK